MPCGKAFFSYQAGMRNVWAKFQKKAVRMYLLLFVLFLYLFLTFKLFKRLKCFVIKKEKFFSDAFVYMYVCMKAD